MPHN